VRTAALALCGAVLNACVLFWVARGDQTRDIQGFLAVYAAAFAAYLAALRVAASGPVPQAAWRLALSLALAWRVALALAPPLLSDDVYRSVWEGRIQLHGGNPYAWADRPESERWAELRDPAWQRVNHKDYTAVYPPLWQLAVRAVVAIHDSAAAVKLFLVACEGATLWVLAALLRRRGLPAWRLLVLAWSPLSLVEVAGSGHNDALGALFVAMALAALEARRPLPAGLACALGFQAKLLPGLLALAWLRRLRPPALLAAGVLAALLVWPYAGAGAGLWRSLAKYGEFWRFNETLFAGLAALLGDHASAARLSLASVSALALAAGWRRDDPASAALIVVASWLLLSPNVLPWYALWLLPLLVVRDCAGALLFTGTVALAYLVYPAWRAGAAWQVSWPLRALEYGPCVLLALASAWRMRERRRAETGPAGV
jgi:hypothetical protein